MSDNTPPADRSAMRRLLILIAVYFLVEALCDPEGLIYQSIILFLKDAHGWTESQVNNVFSAMSIPLLARPLYGILCDSVPLFGYKRKSYLAGFMLCNMAGYAAIAFLNSPFWIVAALFVVAVGVSGGGTVATAVMVEKGNEHGNSASLINIQWFWYNLGVLVFALAGGWLARHLAVGSTAVHLSSLAANLTSTVTAGRSWWSYLPLGTGYQVAAVIAALGPAFVVFAVFKLLDEPRSKGVDLAALKESLTKLKAVLLSRAIWITSAFIVVYNISPLMKVPLIYHLSDHLKFSPTFIGILLAIGAVGAMVGSFVFKQLETRLTLQHLLYVGVALGVLSRLSYLLLGNAMSAEVIWFVNGVASMVILVPCLSLAALRCPKGLEAFGYGTMTCFLTLSRTTGSWVGGWLYESVFHSNITWLIIVSAILAAAALPLIPFLKLGDAKSGK